MKHNVGTLLGVVGVTTAATLLGVGEAKAVVLAIDDFNDGAFFETLSPTVGADFTDTQSGLSVLGGTRTVFSEVTSVGAVNNSNVNVNTTFNQFNLNEGSGIDLETTITYDAGGSGLGGIDFSGRSGIEFDTISSVGLEANITLTDTNGNTSTSPVASSITGSTTLFKFSDFTSSGSFNLASIDKVDAVLDSPGAGVSSTIGNVNAPMEPVPFEAETSAALLLLGTWGSWKYWKKRNQQKVQLTASNEN